MKHLPIDEKINLLTDKITFESLFFLERVFEIDTLNEFYSIAISTIYNSLFSLLVITSKLHSDTENVEKFTKIKEEFSKIIDKYKIIGSDKSYKRVNNELH